jgi:hypothetical protein
VSVRSRDTVAHRPDSTPRGLDRRSDAAWLRVVSLHVPNPIWRLRSDMGRDIARRV